MEIFSLTMDEFGIYDIESTQYAFKKKGDMNTDTLLIGGHVSAAGGIVNALSRGKDIGGNCVQIFSASPRVWARTPISQDGLDTYNQRKSDLGIKKTVIHAIYLLNLASENPELREKSRSVIEYDLRIDAAIGGSGVVVHLGSHQGRGFEATRNQMVQEIKRILDNTPEESTFLIENSAGQSGKIASDIAEIRWLIDEVGSKRVGWCLDTCHAYCAGYSLENDTNASDKNIFAEIEKYHLWDALKVVHVNDSRDAFGSGRDRHQNLGDGSIGNDTFRSFLSNKHIRTLPLILEVPGVDGKSGPDKENIIRLQQLAA